MAEKAAGASSSLAGVAPDHGATAGSLQVASTSPAAGFAVSATEQMTGRIKTVLKECAGPSFDERCQKAAKEYRKQTKRVEDNQKKLIEEALVRAKARPCASAAREKELQPASIEERYRVNTQLRRQKEAEFARRAAETRQQLKAREPIFRVSEVEAVFEEQRRRQAAHRRELREEEARRWEHIRELQAKVIERPLLVENYERPQHIRSLPELRLIPEHTKATPLQAKVSIAITRKKFLDSAWGKEVESIRSRQDNRQKLHEIQYPPKVFKPKPLGPRELMPVEVKMNEVIASPWFQKSDWAERVREIRQRMDDRPKLHEISYPPKH